MVTWSETVIGELLSLGRSGTPFDEIARAIGTTDTNAQEKWWRVSSKEDQVKRKLALAGFTQSLAAPSGRVFFDDPAARRDRGSNRLHMPTRETWVPAGTSLA